MDSPHLLVCWLITWTPYIWSNKKIVATVLCASVSTRRASNGHLNVFSSSFCFIFLFVYYGRRSKWVGHVLVFRSFFSVYFLLFVTFSCSSSLSQHTHTFFLFKLKRVFFHGNYFFNTVHAFYYIFSLFYYLFISLRMHAKGGLYLSLSLFYYYLFLPFRMHARPWSFSSLIIY